MFVIYAIDYGHILKFSDTWKESQRSGDNFTISETNDDSNSKFVSSISPRMVKNEFRRYKDAWIIVCNTIVKSNALKQKVQVQGWPISKIPANGHHKYINPI